MRNFKTTRTNYYTPIQNMISMEDVEDEDVEDGDAPAPHSRPGQGETVLVVEDDEIVRMLITQVLDELGYRYVEASGALAAVALIESGQTINLIVTDVGLPDMNGRQLAEIARQRQPDLKELFVTGYAQNAAAREGFLEPGMAMMTKPFALDLLGARIRELIES